MVFEVSFINLIVITYLYFLDLRGFKLFLRLIWEPFEEQFKPIEARFLNNADIVFRLVMTYSANMGRANMEHQNNAYKKEIEERQEGIIAISSVC